MNTSPLRIMVLSTSPQTGSVSTAGCRQLVGMLRARGSQVDHIGLSDLPPFAAGLDDEDYCAEIQALLSLAHLADAVVLGAPVHRSRPSGSSRNALELLRGAIAAKPVLCVLGAGSARAHLAGAELRADLFINFAAHPLDAVIISPDESCESITSRLMRAAADLDSQAATRREASR